MRGCVCWSLIALVCRMRFCELLDCCIEFVALLHEGHVGCVSLAWWAACGAHMVGRMRSGERLCLLSLFALVGRIRSGEGLVVCCFEFALVGRKRLL